jgi:hypothetical protein
VTTANEPPLFVPVGFVPVGCLIQRGRVFVTQHGSHPYGFGSAYARIVQCALEDYVYEIQVSWKEAVYF